MGFKFFNDWQILKSGRRADFIIIAAITLIFVFVIIMNVRLIFQMTSNQTEEIGKMQLETIRDDLQGALTNAGATTAQMAIEVEQLINSGATFEQLKKFFYAKKKEQFALTNGVCINVYVTTKHWTIIPDFNIPEGFHTPERLWYKGAVEHPERVYVTEPYSDAAGNGICFTMSKVLSDGETVVGMDFTLSDIQRSILRMTATSDRAALIVTKSGMIIGYNDMSLVGGKISKQLPEYENILARVLLTNRHDTFSAQLNDKECTIFSSQTRNGWYMILSVDNEAFYQESYRQIIFTIAVSFAMMIAIIFFYLNAMKNGLKAENALRVKEEFLSRLSTELKTPLHNILSLSSEKVLAQDEKAAQVRESALKLSDMLDNLFSFSTIVSNDKKKLDATNKFQDLELSKVSRSSRAGIITVLTVSMLLSLGLCIKTTINWGDTAMKGEVESYEHQLSNWIENQRTLLSMFSNIVLENPEIVKDYPSAVKFLNDIAKHYPEISVCYIANPYQEHQIIMNNGWEPPADWHVDQRPWYIETFKSDDNFNISAPYYDEQTGGYCVTFSQVIYGNNNEFLGVFAIDFYLDRLTQILGESYTKTSYAFLVDRNGVIINHPNNNYQMTVNNMTEIFNTEYRQVYSSGTVDTIKDYTGDYMACLAQKERTSNFTVIVAQSWWKTYGYIFFLSFIFIILLMISVLLVGSMINKLLRWQDSVNRKLQTSSATAVAASAAKSQFLAQMSHEIRTPINAVLGMNEMILRESKNGDILEYASNIQSAGRTLLTLINSILDFSKIEDGKMEIIPVRYETVTLIDDLENMISEKAKKKGLTFQTEISPNIPSSLYGDDVRIRQIITNLLTNAVKYTHEGSVTLKIDGREIDADTFEMQVKISDTGIGIREEDLGKLFKSFIRLDEERNRNIEGTGLGIAIVQKLLAMMNSNLEVSSVYGKGSTFSFKLIQKIIDRNAVGNYYENKIKYLDKNASNKYLVATGAKVLAVDDNNMNLKVIRGLLKRNEIVPDLADSGQQCLEMARKNFYHIIFLDNMMPVMNGVETLKHLQQEKILNEKTSVIMLTASAIAGMRELYLKEGFDDYLSKPIEVPELELMLQKHLPPEMISFKVDEAKTVDAAEIEKEIEVDAGEINTETGLEYSAGIMELYQDILQTFANLKDEKKLSLQKSFDAGDWKNYTVYVHALKSNAQSIGADKLFNAAKDLEAAGKKITAENISESERNSAVEFIKENHAALLKMYDKIADKAKNIFATETVDATEIETEIEKEIEVDAGEINTETGLEYSAGILELYQDILQTFANLKDEKKLSLQKSFDAGDWKNYTVYVHALKSNAQSIGADKLFNAAKDLEAAGKKITAENISESERNSAVEFIKENHAALLKMYDKIADKAKNIFATETVDATEIETEIEKEIEVDAGEINTETGLEYSAGIMELYQDILQTFANLKDEKKLSLQKSFDAGDWKNYTVYVHALKSNAQSIGADKLFNAAKDLEAAGKKITAENISESERNSAFEFIKENHAALLKMYDKIADKAKNISENLES